jgi:glycosyltransferase involved in cell wall biosynthesis
MGFNEKPILSFVAAGRNDNYQGNFLYRFSTAINYTSMELKKIGKLNEMEYVIVDWGSEIPLHTVLPLEDAAKKITRFIQVPPGVAREQDGPSPFATTSAVNVGIRRSRADYISTTVGDILYDSLILEKMCDVFSRKCHIKQPLEKTLFLIGLKNIPYDVASSNMDLVDVEKFIADHRDLLPIHPMAPYLCGGAAAFIMHRDRWSECQGWNESIRFWGWSDHDLKMRINLIYGVSDFSKEFGVYSYHLDHWPPNAPVRKDRNKYVFCTFTIGQESWGLADKDFDEYPVLDKPTRKLQNIPMKDGEPRRIKHLDNLFRFLFYNFNVSNVKLTILLFVHFIDDSPEKSFRRKFAYILKVLINRVSPVPNFDL